MDDRLDAALRSMQTDVAFPPTPDLRASVGDRLAAPESRSWWPSALPRAVALALVATLVLAATAAALALLIPGLRLTFVPALPWAELPDDPVAARLTLGEPIPPGTVDRGIPSELGAPDEAYVLGENEVLTLVYRADDQLPPMAETEIGLLVQVIDGVLDEARVEKLVAEVGASVSPTEVDGASGYWISGPPHLVRYITPGGGPRSQSTRLVGDTLVWERDGVLYRIESGLGMDATLRIAESIEP
jgi:hypothetical protein